MHKSFGPRAHFDTLARLFPHCVTEAQNASTGEVAWAIDFDLLRQELSDHIVDGPQERYRLDWPGKRAAALSANLPSARKLQACRAGSIDFDTTQHLFIQGDNLDALKLLQPSHGGAVQVIFIDPPYNSGKPHTYRDCFKMSAAAYAAHGDPNTEAEGRFHADWLNMMYPRLKLAWHLLADDGFIAVAIDDHELLQLGNMLDEIFGPQQRLACAPWRSEASGGKEKSGLRCGHEYVLLYVKRDRGHICKQERAPDALNLSDAQGPYRKGRELMKWGGTSLRSDRPNQCYPLRNPRGEAVLPFRHDGEAGHWRWGKDNPRIIAAQQDPTLLHWEMRPFDPGVRVAGQTQRWVPYEKLRQTQRLVRWSTWLDGVGTNADATRELKALFGAKVFDTPKPTSLIQWIVGLHPRRNAVVLDFFAGSASTADAVLRLNRADGGARRFIMVQSAEPTAPGSPAAKAGYAHIAALGRERVRRAGEALAACAEGTRTEGTCGNGTCGTGTGADVGFRLLELV